MFGLKSEFIYINNKNMTLKKVYKLAKQLGYSCFALWLYPKAKLNVSSLLKKRCTTYKKLELVTVYNGKRYKKNFLVLLDKKSLKNIYKKANKTKQLDSIAFYKPHKKKWEMCFIPHENNQIIIKYSKKAEKILYKKNIEFTTIPPEGW